MTQRPRGLRTGVEIAEVLAEAGAFKINLEVPFTHTSGLRAPAYLNCRNLPDAVRRDLLKDLMLLSNLRDRRTVVVGVQNGGAIWSKALAEQLGRDHASVRKEVKLDEGWIEGVDVSDRDAFLIEDVCNSGGSTGKAIRHLEAVGARVIGCCALFAYSKVDMYRFFNERFGIPFRCLAELFDFGGPMARRGLPEEEWDKVLAGASNPQAWHDTWVAAHPGS